LDLEIRSGRSYAPSWSSRAFSGAALLYGDGIITPSISVLSAIEGLEVATDAAKPFIVPLTCIGWWRSLSCKNGAQAASAAFLPCHDALVS